MSLFYQEKDLNLYRQYTLQADNIPISFQTAHAKVDIVQTCEYGPMFFIDGVLQAAAVDEYIYHEFLVHPPMMYASQTKSIGIFGGGDGCALREIFKWKSVESVDLFDWDKHLVEYFKNHGNLWNQGSLKDKRVTHHATDISTFFTVSEYKQYDVIVIDLLDPEYADLQNPNGFWHQLLTLALRWKKEGGSIVINAGGLTPWQNGNFKLLKQLCETIFSKYSVIPYKVFVPSFGREWGYLCIVDKKAIASALPFGLRRVCDRTFRQSVTWEPDFKIDAPY